MDLVEYSDEVGENYDFEAWLEDDAEEKSLSIMDLHGSIEETFAEVCDYSAENEIENFYKVAKNAVKEISEGEY